MAMALMVQLLISIRWAFILQQQLEIFIEAICVIMLMIGFLAKPNAALLFIEMIGALIILYWQNVSQSIRLGKQKSEGFEPAVLMYTMYSFIIIYGS